MVFPVTLVLFCLLIVEDIVQDTTVQIKGSWIEVTQFCPSVYNPKNTLATALLFDAPTIWNDLPDEVRSLPQLSPASVKGYNCISSKRHSQLSIHSIQCLCGTGLGNDDDFLNWILVLCLRVCLAEIKCHKSTE